MKNTKFLIRPSGGGVGAFVEGINLVTDLSAEIAQQLRTALGEYGVLFFRDQALTPEEHIAAAEQFGEINVNRFFAAVDGYPRIAQVLKEPHQLANIGGGWHTDRSYDVVPAMGSMLLAREVPTHGGDTLFANMYSAFEALSDGLKKTLERMRAVHSSRHVFGPQAKYLQDNSDLTERFSNNELATQDSVHPVVIRHPISGRKALYVNGGFTMHFEGWTAEESSHLLKFLFQHASRPEFTYRFQWTKHSIAFWDSRATWHYALNDYTGERRLMHRITLEGEPIAA